MPLKTFLPTAELVTSAPVVELAGCVLRDIALMLSRPNDSTCESNYVSTIGQEYGQHGIGRHKEVMQAVAEAWAWLRSNGFICWHVDHGEQWVALTRLGKSTADVKTFGKWVEERELPTYMLIEDLRDSALP